MLSRWTRTSIRSGVTPKRWTASMTSRPLFIRVAESIVILAPMFQLGCLRAILGVMAERSSLVLPKKGPPEAVNSILFRWQCRYPSRHWKIAECSESTGRILTPFSAARAITSSPPATSVSLLARARVMPASMAARVGRRPIIPMTELRTMSAPLSPASSQRPERPVVTLTGRSATRARKLS